MQILLINSHQHTFNSVRIPAGQWHAYMHAIFAHDLHGLSRKLAGFQDEYGFSWWNSEAARIKALLEQDNFLQPSRQSNYWRKMPYHHSVFSRKQQSAQLH
ncbi:hypothetical protein [Shewanella sp. MTB7]|uniref:hypothetical protein n=1 Tax=Shewanella sp. MTB7 TaxID=2746932 RepID=UPI0022BA5CC0|nr:hypothetical protein [Shewanella sp. MTB7]WBJ95691.1 hypothetical protein HWQ47_00710 [Shewanella sp. MTB7]